MQVLETGRLILRPFRESDLQDFYEYAKNPNVGPNAGWKPHENIGESRAILRRFIDEDTDWAIVGRAEGRVIGSFGLMKDTMRDVEGARTIGYVLAEPYWGRGYMTEAVRRVLEFCFDEMGLKIVSVFHFPFNDRSRRVIEKAGFTREGTLRQCHTVYDGRIYDRVCYSMTRAEYEARKGR